MPHLSLGTIVRIKDDAWQRFLSMNAMPHTKPNPGPQMVSYTPSLTTVSDRVMLDYPVWWFWDDELTIV